MDSKYTNTKYENEGSSKLAKLLKLTICVTTIGFSCAALYQVAQLMRFKDDPSEKSQLSHDKLATLTDPAAFMKAYLAANCDQSLRMNTQSIRYTGTIERKNNQHTFQFLKKRPNLMRYTVDLGRHEITIGVNERLVWQRVRVPSRVDSVSEITGAEATAWRTEGRFFDRIVNAHLGNGQILKIEIIQYTGNDCLKVKTDNAEGQQVDVLIDPETMHPLVERQRLSDGTLKESIMDDYQVVDGMPLPFLIESRIDGKFESRTRVDSARLNAGLLSELFERPQPKR